MAGRYYPYFGYFACCSSNLSQSLIHKGEKMKKIIIFVFCFILTAQISQAHPPSQIDLSYNKMTRNLEVVIGHSVNNPEKHFVKKVVVKKNNKDLMEETFQGQDNSRNQTIIIPVSAEKGDIITAQAYCNISGKMSESITIK